MEPERIDDEDLIPPDEWDQEAGESNQAYAAFRDYFQLPPRFRSINEAYRVSVRERRAASRASRGTQLTEAKAEKERQEIAAMSAPGNWRRWSTKHRWVARAAAWDAHVEDQLEARWIERREELRQADWEMGQTIRGIVTEGMAEARRFVRSHVERIPAENGQPAQIIITQTFDITGLALVAEKASKLQRLAAGEATEHTKWSGSTLDKLIEQELARIANGSQAGNVEPLAETKGPSE